MALSNVISANGEAVTHTRMHIVTLRAWLSKTGQFLTYHLLHHIIFHSAKQQQQQHRIFSFSFSYSRLQLAFKQGLALARRESSQRDFLLTFKPFTSGNQVAACAPSSPPMSSWMHIIPRRRPIIGALLGLKVRVWTCRRALWRSRVKRDSPAHTFYFFTLPYTEVFFYARIVNTLVLCFTAICIIGLLLHQRRHHVNANVSESGS